MNVIVYLLLIISAFQCALLQKPIKIKPLEFDYQTISQNYFGKQEKPFPLTVQSGINFQASTTEDGRYLVYTTDKESNFDIFLRDLKTSVSIPVTKHPAAEYKPAISPDGKYLAFVSEELDSEGDIVLVKFDPQKWIERHLQGKPNELENLNYITNPSYKDINKRDRWKDKEPQFSPDGKKLIFVSERFTPPKLNLVIYEIDTQRMYPITTEGGTSPCFSKDGKYVFYISNKEHASGEIYQLNLTTKEETRLTFDEYLDFSVSTSPSSKEIYYISIRKDTNANNILDIYDNSFIVKLNLETKKEYLLSSGKNSIQEVYYSNFNGGSLLHSLSLYNSVNIFFIPSDGAIPKKNNINEQFEQARQIQKEYSREYFLLGLDSVKTFFENHEIYPIYKAKVLDLNFEDLYLRKEKEEFQNLLKTEKVDKSVYFGKFIEMAIYVKWRNFSNQAKQISEYQKIIAQIPKNDPIFLEENCSILELIGNAFVERNQVQNAAQTYERILQECPNYHNKEKIDFNLAKLSYTNVDEIPTIMFQILENPTISVNIKRDLLNILEERLLKQRTLLSTRIKAEELKQKFKDKSRLVAERLDYIIAKTYFEEKNYSQAIKILDSFLKPLPIQDQECWRKPGCKLIEICENDPTCLKSHLLKFKCFEAVGEKEESFKELKAALENYNPILGVEIPESEIEKTFRHFENAAKTYYSLGRTYEAAISFFFNTENIFLLKQKNLHVNTLYKKYAVYYYQKMIDTVIEMALLEARKARESFLNQINILSKDRLDLFGWISSVFDIASKTRITKNLKILGDFKDLDRQLILGENAIKLLEVHFKIARPRAREILYLAALYGYAYYLVNKAYILDTFHIENETMTNARKEEILSLFKTAEYELKWIIYADPTYYEAYQLLGWLYQYIDVVRYQKISDSESTQNDLYANVYDRFFSRKYLEENLSLYEQILIFLGDYSNKKVLSDLHLNLANNYMILNNYNRALENFEKVEKLHKFVNSDSQFENSKQRTLFEYNYARALLYQNRFEDAVLHFNKALSVIEREESFKQNNIQKENLEYKKALLNALIGLSYLEAEKYRKAIFHIEQTIALNYNGNFFNLAPLYNYLAYSYLKASDMSQAKKYLEIAKKEYSNKIDFKFNLIDSLWNLILPERIRIIGESRFPGALPWEFNYLFSLGIEAEIYEREGNFEKLYELFEHRKKFIYKHDLEKMSMGEKILAFQSAHMGYFEYFRGDIGNSRIYYTKAIKNTESWDEKWKWQLRKSLALINSTQVKSKDYLEEISSLNKFEEIFIQSCVSEEQKSFQEERKLFCKEKFISNFKDYEILLGILNYKLAQYFREKNYNLYFYYLGIALNFFKRIGNVDEDLHFLKQDPIPRMKRLELKLTEAQIYLELLDYASFDRLERELNFIFSQLELKEELFYWKVLIGIRRYATLKTRNELLSLKKYHENLLNSILNDPYLLHSLSLNWIHFEFQELKKIYLKEKDYEKLFYLEELYQTIVLFRNFLNNNLEFENYEYNTSFQMLKKEFFDYFLLNFEFRELVKKRENVDKLIQKMKSAQKEILRKVLSFQNKFPLRSSFLDWNKNFSIKLKPVQAIIKISFVDSKILCFVEEERMKKIKVYSNLADFENDKKFWTLDNRNEIFLIIHPTNFDNMNKVIGILKQNYREKIKKLVFRTNQLVLISENSRPSFEKVIFSEQTSGKLENFIYNVDVLIGETFGQNETNIFGEEKNQKLNLRELLKKEHNISSIIVKTEPENLWMSYEILAISKIPFVMFVRELPPNNVLLKDKFLEEFFEKKLQVGNLDYKVKSFFSISDFNFHIKRALEFEHIHDYPSAIREIGLASANLDLNLKDENSLKADFIDARIKTKLYREGGFFFDQILKKYRENEIFTFKILENTLKFCYSTQLFDCEPFYKEYYKQALNKNIDLKLRKQSFFVLKNYRYLGVGKYNQFDKNFFEKLNPSEFEDEFLLYEDLISLLQTHFYYEEADYFVRKLLEVCRGQREKQIAEESYFNLQILMNLSGFGPKRDIKTKDIYSSLINKDWKEFFLYLKQLRLAANESSVNLYRAKLIEMWKRLEIGEDYDPFRLKPERSVSGKSIFYYLDDKDKLLVFYILYKSLNVSNTFEINSIFDELVSKESNTNLKMAAYLTLVYMEALFTRPDFRSLENYITIFETKFKNLVLEEEWLNRFEFLKYKYSLFTKKQLDYGENAKMIDYFEYYEKFKKLDFEEYYSAFFGMLGRKKKEKFDSRNKRELNDLISFLQKLSFEKGKTELFLDLVFFKDRINSINERFYKKNFQLGDIGSIYPITKKLIEKLPKNQKLEFVVNFELQTFNIKCTKQMCTGDEIISDNRAFRDRIYNYYRNLQLTGSALLEKEALEKTLRDLLQFDPTQKTYLYLSGFWLKIPFEIKENDNIYFIQSPEQLYENPVKSEKELFPEKFFIKKYLLNNEKNFSLWRNLEEIEILSSKRDMPAHIHIIHEPLVFKNLDQILLGKKPLVALNPKNKKLGVWILYNSGLYETSFLKDDLNHALYLLGFEYNGIGVFSIGPQIQKEANLAFTKEFLKRYEFYLNPPKRFGNALNSVKLYFRELDWTGYRLYTNCFLIE